MKVDSFELRMVSQQVPIKQPKADSSGSDEIARVNDTKSHHKLSVFLGPVTLLVSFL